MEIDLHQDIPRACWRADNILWNAFERRCDSAGASQPMSRLVFPRYRNKRRRVSEQEARFAFVEALCQSPLYYSIETPTRKPYGFSSEGERSAQTDLTVRDEKMDALCNVEFKSGGISQDAKSRTHIAKDLEKLVREPISGLWFHLLKSVNNSTIRNITGVLANEEQYHFDDIESPGLTVHLCVLRHRFSIQKYFPVPPYRKEDFAIDLRVSSTELLEIRERNEWVITRPA